MREGRLSASGAPALSKKGADLIAVGISRENKGVLAFQGCGRALRAGCMRCSGCGTDALKEQPWSGGVPIKARLAEH